MFMMKDEYKIGVETIDQQHAKLFEIAESAYQALTNSFTADKYDIIVNILKELIEYAEVHFSAEEAYMESIGYKKLFTQKIEHAQFIEKLSGINLEDIDEQQDAYLMELLDYLNNWLTTHILEKDMLITK